MEWIGALIFVVLLFIFPKQIGILIAFFVAVIVAIVGYNQYQTYLTEKEQNLVSISVVYSEENCIPPMPLSVRISNKSKREIVEVGWDFVARRPGYSSNLLDYLDQDAKSDKIIKPGEVWDFCYRVPKSQRFMEPEKVEWSISGKRVTFTNTQ